MALNYKNPPIVEAICEINFNSSSWDMTFPAEHYNRIKKDFPIKKTINHQEIGFEMKPQGINILNSNKRVDILQCFNKKETSVVQIAQNLIGINSLSPYLGWEKFKKLILSNLEIYQSITQVEKPIRISLRFLNKVNVGDTHDYDNVKKYFNYITNIPFEIASNANSMTNVCEFPFPDLDSVLAIQQLTLRADKHYKAPVSFQIAFVKVTDNKKLNIDDWLESAHSKIKIVFENSFTDFAKQQFV